MAWTWISHRWAESRWIVSMARPASTRPPPIRTSIRSYLGIVLEQLPVDAVGENNLRLLIEVPLLRDDGEKNQVSLVEMNGVHVGRASEEVWFLVRPAGEFASGLLPD